MSKRLVINSCSDKEIHYSTCDFYDIFNLTLRESQCLFYLMHGFSIKEIAAKLFLSPRTIEAYYNKLKEKMACYSRSQLVSKAIIYGLVYKVPEGVSWFC